MAKSFEQWESCRIENHDPIHHTWMLDGHEFEIPAAVGDKPGETVVPRDVVNLYLGDPDAMDMDVDSKYSDIRKEHRKQIDTKWGVYKGDNRQIRAEKYPNIKAFSFPEDIELNTIVVDPYGDKISNDEKESSRRAAATAQLESAARQLVSLLGQAEARGGELEGELNLEEVTNLAKQMVASGNTGDDEAPPAGAVPDDSTANRGPRGKKAPPKKSATKSKSAAEKMAKGDVKASA